MGSARNAKSRADFQRRYDAYARNHGMTREQMLAHDRECCPEALLTPYLQWLSDKRIEWDTLCSRQSAAGSGATTDFDRWLDDLNPTLNTLTCECHRKLARGRRND